LAISPSDNHTRVKKGHAISLSKLFSGIKMGWELMPIALRQWRNDDALRLASSLAFYTVFSLAPILLITVGLASIVFSEQEAKRLVIEQIGMMTGGMFSVGKYLIGLYLGRTAIGSTYGAAGSFVVLLVWICYSALICFWGAEITQLCARRYGSRIRPEPHAVRINSDFRAFDNSCSPF
jgi:uncharacterized BrkB/YihY/UPF0761 family membrane protein